MVCEQSEGHTYALLFAFRGQLQFDVPIGQGVQIEGLAEQLLN
jgi:hypothetical protein